MAQIFIQNLRSEELPHFSIICGGFVPRDNSIIIKESHSSSLHIIGMKDEIVMPSKSWQLVALLSSSPEVKSDFSGMIRELGNGVHVLEHEGGHYLPTNSEYRHLILAWIKSKSKL